MKSALTVVGGIILLVFILIAVAAQSRQAQQGHGLCIAGKLTAPCDSWLMKQQPFKIKLTHGAKDKK